MFRVSKARRFLPWRFVGLRSVPIAVLAVFVVLTGPTIATAQDNGIAVSRPKVYDNQSLAILLDQLETRLHDISVVDQTSIQKSFGLVQGSEEQDTQRAFSVTASPPAAAATSSKSGGGAPVLPELPSAPGYKPNYGESPGDLLSDQVDLQYQLFNLSMLIERSVSDAVRRQVLIGFTISVDPPTNATDAAAYVEVTLSCDAANDVSLVASMPQEKTYNATALSSSATAFGASAVAKIISVGYSQSKRHQTFFVYRDTDTLAVERRSEGNKVIFGWIFRPVLGRRSVSPGMRQLFAVVSLPYSDKITEESDLSISATAKTYWRHYDRQTATSVVKPGAWDFAAKRVPPPAEFTLDFKVPPTAAIEKAQQPMVSNPQILQIANGITDLQIEGDHFTPGTTVAIGDKIFSGPKDGLVVLSPQRMHLTTSLDVTSHPSLALVNGRHGAAVPIFTLPGDGLEIRKAQVRPKGPKFSELSFTLGKQGTDASLTRADLANVPKPIFSINGTAVPYPTQLVDTNDPDGSKLIPHVIASVIVPTSLVQSRDERIGFFFPLLGQRWSTEQLIYDDAEVQVTKMAGGKTTTLLMSRPGLEFTGNWRLILDKSYDVKNPTLAVASQDISSPSRNSSRHSSPPQGPPTQRRQPAKDATTPAVEFTRLMPCHDESINKDNACYMLKIVADTKFLSDYKKFVLVSDKGYAQTLDVPADSVSPEATPPVQPKITGITPATVGLNEVVTVTITGTGLDAIKQVSFEGKPLTFWTGAEKDKTTNTAGAKPPETGSPSTPTTPQPITPAVPALEASGGNATASATAKSPETANVKPPTKTNSSTPAVSDSGGKATQLHVLITRDVTGKEGHQEILLQVDAKTMLTATVTVSPAPTATKSPTTKGKKSP